MALVMLVSVAACWTVVTLPWDDTAGMAQRGVIEDRAPVKASVGITIHASPQKVWRLLTDVNDWPKWHSAIGEAQLSVPLAAGRRFSWKAGGIEIHSTIGLVEPFRILAWSGKALGAKAVHVWKLQPLPGGQTAVHVDESMDGLLMRIFYSSKQLTEDDQGWLEDLKAAAEK